MPDQHHSGPAPDASMPLVDVAGLRVRYRDGDGYITAVDGVDLAIRPGEVLGLVGESGSGKTTTALALAGLLPSDADVRADRLLLGDLELATLSERVLRRVRGAKIGVVFQDPMTSLNPLMTIGAQIGEVAVTHLGLSRRAARARARDLLERVGLSRASERLRGYPHQLSGGMRQRVMLAMALAGDPVLLVADEPTTALDVTVQAQVLDLLRSVCAERRLAVLFVTHDLSVAASLCQEVMVMYAGQVVESGRTADVFDSPLMPYTSGLLRSHVTLDADRSQALPAIEGEPPILGDLPAGCRFAPRCEHRRQRCEVAQPLLTPRRDDRQLARCWATQTDGWLS